MKRRMLGAYKRNPLLVKLTNTTPNLTHTILNGYKYADLLVVSAGGGGGFNSGGGGSSGTLLYVKNIILSKLIDKQIKYTIAPPSPPRMNGSPTTITLNGTFISVEGGHKGSDHGDSGGYGPVIDTTIVTKLSPYVQSPSDIAIANNGGGAGGSWSNSDRFGYSGGAGASMSQNGGNGSGQTGGSSVTNSDGFGGYLGGTGNGIYGGGGRRLNSNRIPISLFEGGQRSGKGGQGNTSAGSGSGGGAAGYSYGGDGSDIPRVQGGDGGIGSGGGGGGGDNGEGGKGGQGIICIYYHN